MYQKIISYFFHFKKTQVYIQKKEWINLLEIFIFRLFWVFGDAGPRGGRGMRGGGGFGDRGGRGGPGKYF